MSPTLQLKGLLKRRKLMIISADHLGNKQPINKLKVSLLLDLENQKFPPHQNTFLVTPENK